MQVGPICKFILGLGIKLHSQQFINHDRCCNNWILVILKTTSAGKDCTKGDTFQRLPIAKYNDYTYLRLHS